MQKAMYEVKIGIKEGSHYHENFDAVRVLANTAAEAAKKAKLPKGQYVSEVRFLGREG